MCLHVYQQVCTQLCVIGAADQEGIYDNKSGVLPNRPLQESGRSPSFDDPTYASIWKKPAAENPSKSNRTYMSGVPKVKYTQCSC